MASEKVFFQNSRGLKLAGIIDRPDNIQTSLPAVVICHGFTGFKEFKPLHNLAKTFAENSFVALRFDFSDCIGESEGKCEDMMLSHQVNDLLSAVNFLEDMDYVDKSKIGVTGHSLGGLTAIVATNTDRRIKLLVPISAPAKVEWQNLFNEDAIKSWVQQGSIEYPTYKRGHVKLHHTFIEDLKEYDGTELIKNVKVPVRIIHGNNDEVVPVKNAHSLFENANEPKDLQIIEDADHMFLKDEHLNKMSEKSLEWFKTYLKS
ncbi:MAG: prolyl oligopeptidase family serine peptidase [Candidatus Aenigmarchaeota archaeon]|nr:prolyl oligopeptidase family serine peptidase [Candidatus Aenigmarchaeota archaeon]